MSALGTKCSRWLLTILCGCGVHLPQCQHLCFDFSIQVSVASLIG